MKKPILIEIIIWFIILTIIFTLGIFIYSKIFVELNVYTVEFKDIYGITKGSPVRFMGINVGYVRKLEVKNGSILAQIIITKKDVKIPNGTVARVEFYGLGGSKSIELMPPDGSCNVGILSDKTIRLHDVANSTKGIVAIIELVEEIVHDMNFVKIENTFKNINELKEEQIKNASDELVNIKKEINKKSLELKNKQSDIMNKIDKMNETVGKINRVIKK